MCSVSYRRKKDKRTVLSSDMISWDYIAVILAFGNHCLFSRAFVYTSFSDRSAMSIEKRINPKFFVCLRKTSSQALEIRKWVYRENSMLHTCVFERHKMFKEGREVVKVEYLNGWHSTSRTEVNVEWVRQGVSGDRRTVWKIIIERFGHAENLRKKVWFGWFLCLMAYQLFFRLFNAKAILLEEQ